MNDKPDQLEGQTPPPVETANAQPAGGPEADAPAVEPETDSPPSSDQSAAMDQPAEPSESADAAKVDQAREDLSAVPDTAPSGPETSSAERPPSSTIVATRGDTVPSAPTQPAPERRPGLLGVMDQLLGRK